MLFALVKIKWQHSKVLFMISCPRLQSQWIQRKDLVGQEKVYDQDLIYGRVIWMLVSSMFCADGQMKISKGKSILKNNMQVTISERNCSTFDTVIYDVSALLWYSSPKVEVPSFCWDIQGICEECPKALKRNNCVFDRYFVNSIKTSARMQRAESSRVHNLLLDMSTPQEQVTISVTKNKVQLNAVLAEALLDPGLYITHHKIVWLLLVLQNWCSCPDYSWLED